MVNPCRPITGTDTLYYYWLTRVVDQSESSAEEPHQFFGVLELLLCGEVHRSEELGRHGPGCKWGAQVGYLKPKA